MAITTQDQRAAASEGRIVTTPGICGGKWRISGTRITVDVLTRSRELGASDQELLEDYPSLSREDLAAAWSFSAQHPSDTQS